MGRFFECQSTSFTFFISIFLLQGAKVKLRLGRDVPDHLPGENPTVGSFINHVEMTGGGLRRGLPNVHITAQALFNKIVHKGERG